MRGEVDVPLHARYLAPDPAGASWQALFAALRGEETRHVHVFGEGAPGRIEAAYECGDRGEEMRDTELDLFAELPVADARYRLPVEIVTAAVVWAGWAWVLLAIVRAARRGKRKTE
jgi:hypothetical protein